MSNPYQQYRSTAVQTAPPEQLVVMLYDGVIRFLEQSKVVFREGKDPADQIGKAQDIIVELAASLDHSTGEIAQNLARIYDFWLNWLIQAHAQRDLVRIDQILTMVRELREAWVTTAQTKRAATVAAPVEPVERALNARG